jgi:hypothetical protein
MTTDERVIEDLMHEAQMVAPRIAADEGPPPLSKRLSQADEDRLFALKDGSVDYNDVFTKLLTTGLPPEEAQQLAIVKEQPQLLQTYLQPAPDSEMAHALAVLAEHPFRFGLTITGHPDPDEQVKRAKSLARRSGQPAEPMSEEAPTGPQTASPSLLPTAPPNGAPMASSTGYGASGPAAPPQATPPMAGGMS